MHLWKGLEIDNTVLDQLIDKLKEELAPVFYSPLSVNLVLDTLEKFLHEISDDTLMEWLSDTELSESDKKYEIGFLKDFIKKDHLLYKIKKEMGDIDFLDLKINLNENDIYEGRKPLGILTHITPANSSVVSFLAAIEGLFSGNLNIIKLSSKDSDFTIKALKRLGNLDESEIIKQHLIVLKISSEQKDLLQSIVSISNGVSVWGGDQAVSEIKRMTPPQCKVISWGHKISFAYITKEYFDNEQTFQDLACDVINLEQQACSSPQCIFLETDNYEEVKEFSKKFFNYLKEASDKKGMNPLDMAVQCEITNTNEVIKLEKIMKDSLLLEDPDGKFRIYVEKDSNLTPSPLFRTIWIKPLPAEKILTNLFNWRNHLQTIGFAGDYKTSKKVLNNLLGTGTTRITKIGKMLDTYRGEAHDGVFPLNEFTKNVRVELAETEGVSRLNYSSITKDIWDTKVMDKMAFQKMGHDLSKAKLFFKSGGSSGQTAYSSFSYEDYYLLMDAAKEGLMAAGLNPKSDRAMNLFFGGGLYGGMISFFTILERMEAIQYSMGAWPDLDFVVDTIISNNINVILGMTSYIMQLLEHGKDKLKQYKGLEKIFYGGEHFSQKQKEWVHKNFTIDIIRSASYGSVDAGPLGYQCEYCEGSIHHLHDHVHFLEILKFDEDINVEDNELGRLVFSTPMRETLTINRYEIGDTGRWIKGKCKCGRTSPLFELKGRMGDIFKAGGTFINYQVIEKILREKLSFDGELQLIMSNQGKLDSLEILLDRYIGTCEEILKTILDNYKDLKEVVNIEKTLDLKLSFVKCTDLIRTKGSGKLKRVIDKR